MPPLETSKARPARRASTEVPGSCRLSAVLIAFKTHQLPAKQFDRSECDHYAAASRQAFAWYPVTCLATQPLPG